MNDQHQFSPNNVNPKSREMVVTIIKMFTWGSFLKSPDN